MSAKILLVDDTKTVLMYERILLQPFNFTIKTAENGVEALEIVPDYQPDLIFLDLMMPKMDGFETCRRLKDNPLTKRIPIVIVTTKGEQNMVSQAVEAGCDDYMTKPFDLSLLLSKVRTFITGS